MNPASNSPELQSANKLLRRTLKPLLRYLPSQRVLNWINHKRAPMRGLHYDGANTKWITLGSVKTLQVTPHGEHRSDVCMMYFHGGAYTLGSPSSSEADARRLAISCGMTVYSVKYTTAIHAPYPAAVDDAEKAYKGLLAQGVAPESIVLAGTSAGGGLALALLHRLLAKGDPLPACVVTLSAWMDLTMSYPSVDLLAKQDVILSREWTTRAATMYGGEEVATNPEVSPGLGDFTGAPPNLLLYSKVELFRDEVEDFAEKLRTAGVFVQLAAHNHAPHAWPMVAEQAPEAEDAFRLIADFTKQHLRASSP